jgi:lysophospholipase
MYAWFTTSLVSDVLTSDSAAIGRNFGAKAAWPSRNMKNGKAILAFKFLKFGVGVPTPKCSYRHDQPHAPPMTQAFRITTLIPPDKVHLRAGIWELSGGAEPRAVCVLLNGMSEFLEKYGEVASELNARGFTVVSLDWRSQGASERGRAGNRASHAGSFDLYDHDLGALMLHAVEPVLRKKTVPVVALAHSMGAHILLRFLHEHPRRISCAVLTAPMLEIDTGKYSPELTSWIATAMNLRRPSTRIVFGLEERDPLNVAFEDNVCTSDRDRYERNKAMLAKQPFLRVFGPTIGWLGAAFRSMRRIKRSGFPEHIATPVLIFGAGKDRIVKTAAVRDYAKRLPNARYVEVEDSEHEILMEKNSIRARFWAEFDSFMDEQLKTAVPFASPRREPAEAKPARGFTGKAK